MSRKRLWPGVGLLLLLHVYAGGFAGDSLAGFSVAPSTGVLTPLPGSPFNSGGAIPLGYATDNTGRLFIVNAQINQVRVFTTSSGIPTGVAGNPFSAGGLPFGVVGVLHPAGFYIVGDSSFPGRVGVYRISGSGSGTTLTGVAGSPFMTGGSLLASLAVTTSGRVLLAANAGSRNLTVFGVNPGSGALTTLLLQPANTFDASGFVQGVEFVPSVPTVMGDFDGDTKADPTVFRPSSGGWHSVNSSTNYASSTSVSWGLSTDTPILKRPQ